MTQTDADIVISARKLAKTYVLGFIRKKVRATTDVSLEVRRGEIFGLLGPNGAGKTTTIKMLMGLVKPTTGTATLMGHPVGSIAAKRNIGYLPETPYFYDYLTGRELLVFFGQLLGLSRAASRTRAAELLDLVGMTYAADRALRRYSKGMLQRVGLAQALVHNPELVVLDEPLSGLDPLGRKHLRDIIISLRASGKTVLLSSHILSDVELLADRVAIIVNGKTVNCGPLTQLVDAKVLSTEIVVANASATLVEALATTEHHTENRDNTLCVVLQGTSGVDNVIDIVRQHDGAIRAITPRKESLEDVVIRLASSAEPQTTATKGVA